MGRYSIIAILALIGINAGSYFYFTSKLEAKDSALTLERERLTASKEEITSLKDKVAFLETQVSQENASYLKALEEFEEYKKSVSNIKPAPVPSIKPIIIEKEVPAEVVVEQANESSNEVLRRIGTSADNFKRVLND